MKSKKLLCSERLYKFLIAFMMLTILALLSQGLNIVAFALLAFIAIMIFVYALFDTCLSIWILNKFFDSCYCKCKDEDESKL